MSIPPQHRLRKHSEFELVYRCGRRHFSSVLTAFYLLRDEMSDDKSGSGPQVGITVGRILGKATVRNRIKRRVRAAVKQNLKLITRPVDVVINPKKVVAAIDYQQLSSEIARAFETIQQKAQSGEAQTQRDGRQSAAKKG